MTESTFPEIARRRDDAEAESERGRASRLAAARSSGLIDSPGEEAFDSISRLASTLLGAPVGFLSIVDAERDFFKSQVGLPVELEQSREIRGLTFCHHAVARREILKVDDALSDPEWSGMPAVEALGVRAYLGAPVWADGEPIGSLCVVDMRPREWTPVEVETLG